MRQATLNVMTWGTVSAAVGCALWLAAADDMTPRLLQVQPALPDFELPSLPTAAGPVRASSAPAASVSDPR